MRYIEPDTNFYVIAPSAEMALDAVWNCVEDNEFHENHWNVATSIAELSETCDKEGLFDPGEVFVVSVSSDREASDELQKLIDRRRAERAAKKAEEEAKTTSMHGLLSGGPKHNTVSLPDNLKVGNFQLQVESLQANADGSMTVTGTIDAKQLGNSRK